MTKPDLASPRSLADAAVQGTITITEVRQRGTLNADEVAAFLGISVRSVYELARTGGLAALRLGRRLVFPVRPLLRMLGADDETRPDPTVLQISPTVLGGPVGRSSSGHSVPDKR